MSVLGMQLLGIFFWLLGIVVIVIIVLACLKYLRKK